jgi:hypothetical protein
MPALEEDEPMKTLLLTIGAVVAAVTAMAQQPPPRPPRVVTDAQVLAALKDSSLSINEMIRTVGPAAVLPPHTLRPATLAANTQRIRQLNQEAEARSEAIRKGLIPPPPEEDEGTFETVVQLVTVLINQADVAGFDGIAECVDMGNTPFWAMVGHGEEAVPALIRRASVGDADHEPGKALRSMDALEQMLESPTIRPGLSPGSHAAIRQLAADRMKTLRGDRNWRLFAGAAYLAVATRDPQLRKQVEDMNNNYRAFSRQGMGLEAQQKASDLIQQALDKFDN